MELLSMKDFAKTLNDMTFTSYYKRLKLLAKNKKLWEGLPNNIESRWIENFLYGDGYCCYWTDPNKGRIVTACTTDGALNNYEDPVSVTPTGIDIEPRTLIVGQDCVLIRNNYEMIPTDFFVRLFAYRLASLKRTIDVNIHAQKTPYVVLGNSKQVLSLKNIYTKVENNELAIYLDNGLDLENFKVLQTLAPKVFPDLQKQMHEEWNDFLTLIGTNNANTEKRERLITNEVEANNEHIKLSGNVFDNARQDAAKQIKKLFGDDVRVVDSTIDVNENQTIEEEE